MENDNSNKVIMYCIIAVIVLFSACAIIGISMIDFSGDSNKISQIQETPQNTSRKNNTVKNNEIKEDVVEEAVETNQDSSEDEEIIQEDNEEVPKEEIEDKSSADIIADMKEDKIIPENPMAELNNLMSGERIEVSSDRITYMTEDDNVKSYFTFDENGYVTGLFLEMVCETVEEAEYIQTKFSTYLNNVYIEDKSVIVAWPIEDEMRTITKDDMVENLKNSGKYVIEYK